MSGRGWTIAWSPLLEAGQVLYEPGQPLTHVFLPLTGMISLVAVMSDGRTAEGMTIGREGAAGLSASGYVDDAFNRYVVQLPGSGYRVKAEDFEDLVDESVEFCSAVTRWREVMVRMSLQSVACNALHTVRQRLARWILTTHDRTETDRLPLKQEFLAEMLGVKRNAVNIVAREFLSIGAIEYKRGKISVINPDLLREDPANVTHSSGVKYRNCSRSHRAVSAKTDIWCGDREHGLGLIWTRSSR
jgi:CRP-like cAMP-binding protein